MSREEKGQSSHTPSQGFLPTSSSSSPSSLTLPTANTARQHLDSSKKSKNKQIHPGYSMFDWNKVCNSGIDMTGTGGQLLRVTPEELARHCTDKDLWTAVRGVVYNVTQFTKYHPGGKAQLMRGAGQDCTELFDKIHVWVSSESILQKCVVGYLVGFSAPKKPTSLNVSVSKPPFSGDSSGRDSPGTDVLTLNVPVSGGMDISEVGTSNQRANMEEDSRQSGSEEELEAMIPMSGISIDSTDMSIPVPHISVPVPTLPVPISGNISIPVPISTAKLSHLPPYITNHPLISKTAYETAV